MNMILILSWKQGKRQEFKNKISGHFKNSVGNLETSIICFIKNKKNGIKSKGEAKSWYEQNHKKHNNDEENYFLNQEKTWKIPRILTFKV